MKLVLFLQFALLLQLQAQEPAAPPALASTDWVTRSWLSEDGLPQDTVNALVQTRDGFLWVGTNAGLARFDGMQFRTFGLQDGLRSVVVMALAEDRDGVLWVGTSGGGVSRWENGRFTSFGREEGFPTASDVLMLAPDGDGSLWVGTTEGLVHWKEGTFTMVGEAQGLPRKQIRALLVDARGTLWVSALPDGLYQGRNGRFTRLDGPVTGTVESLMEDRDGTVWAGTTKLWKESGETWKRFDADNGLPEAPILALARGRDGTLWVGLRNKGLYRANGDRFEPVREEGLAATQSVLELMVDREGSVWAGQDTSGLHRFAPRLLRQWGAEEGLTPGSARSIAEDPSGGLLVATANRGLFRLEQGRFSPLTDPSVPGTFPFFYGTAATGDGAVWAAGEQCVFRFQSGQPTKAYLEPPVKGDSMRALCPDGDTLWIGTYYAALLKADAGGVQVAAPAGTFQSGITCIVKEAEDTLWVGTSSGLHRWDKGRIQTWTMRDGLLTANIRALHRDPDGTLWIGTLGGGLARMKDGKFVHFTTRQGLIDDVISQIMPDDFGCFWLGSNRGLMRLEREELDAVAAGTLPELHPMVLGRNEGMTREQCVGGTSPTVIRTGDGRLLFPTMGGIVEIEPKRLQKLTSLSPQAGIGEVLVDQQLQASHAALVIPPGYHRLDIAYTAPVLRGGEWVRFRHRLDGFDQDWVSAGRHRLATYNVLPPGRYVFRVAASAGASGWEETGASLAFTVQPFFWQNVWFRGGGVVLLLAAGGMAAWWQQRRKHRLHLEELARERREQEELAHFARLTSLGQLSGSLAHELNQPLAIILSNAQAAQRMLEQEPTDLAELRDTLSDIVNEDKRAGEVIKRLRALLKRGETRLAPMAVNEIVEDVLRIIRSDLIGRGVQVQTELADGLPQVQGDQVQLQQVVLNLITNACDAMAETPPQQRLIRIITKSLDGDVRLSVQDQGSGLPPEVEAKIFQPFFTTKTHGMGIGLSICRSIIAAHHGKLWAEPHAGRGVTFHVDLPVNSLSLT